MIIDASAVEPSLVNFHPQSDCEREPHCRDLNVSLILLDEGY